MNKPTLVEIARQLMEQEQRDAERRRLVDAEKARIRRRQAFWAKVKRLVFFWRSQ